ncbi:MAG: hypothetical protein JWM61_2734 [Micrococcaceae bacterium]|jgi:hypothetical protein|uniref:Uncharacterized protein n=1 Tax=Arthrobacter cheniae TaxID=1258888 RepID=A0A3A5M2D0_9MICC|nr:MULTISPECIES: DUF5703 family protein [Arthrobacter]MCU1634082.1 hypothetical protein [Micrococcaceae bacterium]MEC5200837.1 hypothetical protein [Arthrobacter sp. PL16]RJT76469.1 hypothetical protein D6T63_16215 [Arthrobacter cheniae]
MREHFLNATAVRERDYGRQYEYLVLTVHAGESLPAARKLVTEHAEYGKWELERSCIFMGGSRRYWLRRKVLRVERTA